MTDGRGSPPAQNGRFEDARALAEWDFLRKTPEQRLAWLIAMLELGYASGAFKSGPVPPGATPG